jgi:hypothetical protein
MIKTKVVQICNEKYIIFLIKETEKDYAKYITMPGLVVVNEFPSFKDAQYYKQLILSKM